MMDKRSTGVDQLECDVLVVGSGAGGLSAAITARHAGLDVQVVEKADVIGGTTALSGGVLWIPGNPLAQKLGLVDPRVEAERYLRHEAGDFFDDEKVGAFLDNGPAMVEFFERETQVKFEAAAKFPDYHSDAPGASQGGRSLRVLPYDGRGLGKSLPLLRQPIAETMVFGTMSVAGNELNHFLQTTRSVRSLWYVTKLVARHALDTLLHSRGLRLTNGNALAARLMRTAMDMRIPIALASPVQSLVTENGHVVGAVIGSSANGTESRTIRARRGVVLACGGFPHDRHRRSVMFPHAPTGQEHWSPAPVANTGDGIRLGRSVGGFEGGALPNAAAWVPVSLVPHADGRQGIYPHFFDRGKPGVIAVTRDGRRFANESASYHDMMQALLTAGHGQNAKAYLVCDSQAIRRYGLGYVKPFPFPVQVHVSSGYLKTGATIEALAKAAGLDPDALRHTVERHNADVASGHDTAFCKGKTAYNRVMGDPLHGPNPCLAPIDAGPFYALEIVFGDLGTFAGLRTNARAQVCTGDGKPVRGLYAVGNDMHSVMGGNYPGAGITLGPAMTFGFIAGRALAM